MAGLFPLGACQFIHKKIHGEPKNPAQMSALHSREGEELLVRLNGVGHELPVPEQRVGGHRGGEILRGFFVCDPDGFQGNAVLLSLIHI